MGPRKLPCAFRIKISRIGILLIVRFSNYWCLISDWFELRLRVRVHDFLLTFLQLPFHSLWTFISRLLDWPNHWVGSRDSSSFVRVLISTREYDLVSSRFKPSLSGRFVDIQCILRVQYPALWRRFLRWVTKTPVTQSIQVASWDATQISRLLYLKSGYSDDVKRRIWVSRSSRPQVLVLKRHSDSPSYIVWVTGFQL